MKNIVSLITIVFIFAFGSSASPARQKRIKLTALSSMQRIGQNQKPYGASRVELKSAKNEVESFQVVVAALTENIKVIKAQMSDLVDKNGSKIGKENIKLFRAEYVRLRRPTPRAELPPGLYTDPLVPFINPVTGKPIEPKRQFRKIERWGEPRTVVGYEMYAVPFEVFKGQNQPIWIDVYVPKNVPADVYKGKFKVTVAGNISGEIPVTLTVWDFTLGDGPTHRNHFGNFRNITHYFDVKRDSERFKKIEMRYCRAMAEHRINPPIPRHLLPEVNNDGSLNIIPQRHKALREFINKFHVTDFEIPRAPFASLPRSTLRSDYKHISPANREKAKRYYRQFYNYLKQNGWHKRAYLYMLDEPNLKENYEQVLVLGQLVHEAVPQLRCLVVEQTYPQDPSWPDIDPAVDIWCPLWSFIDRKSIDEKIAHGDEVWSYTALVQRAPKNHPQYQRVKDFDPPYWHIDRPLTVYRVPTWINYQYNITGLLYWSTVTKVIEPWWNPAFSHSGRHFNGGGFLFYPGVPCGIDGPVSSMRLKNLRDGMEDYEYFAILEKLAGKEAVKKIVNMIAPNWWNFSKNPDEFLAAREKIAEQILRLKYGEGFGKRIFRSLRAKNTGIFYCQQ
ncbi:MAG: glycoside hydrolase domain-containing protein [Sedimentisphaerales bacterium]